MRNLPMAKEKCSCSGANLDRFVQPVILDILVHEPCTGYSVVKRMMKYVTFSDCGPDPTGVYRYLKIMKKRGLIVQTDEGAESAGATPLYAVTQAGRECLENWAKTLTEYSAQIGKLASQIKC